MSDCEKHKMEPSPFQLCVDTATRNIVCVTDTSADSLYMLYESDMVLTPPFYIPIPILKALHYVLAYGVADRLLG